MPHVFLERAADGVRGDSTNDRFGDATRQDGQANQSEKQVEAFSQHRCVVVPEEDVDASQNPQGVHDAAQRSAEAVDNAASPLQTGKQMEAGTCYHADQDPRHKTDDKAPHIPMRGPESVERGEDERNERVWWGERPDQQAEQTCERAHGSARTGTQKDSRDDDRDMGECCDDRSDGRKRSERSEADHSLNGEKHGKLGQHKGSIPKRFLQRVPPCRLSLASLAQLLRPFLCVEKAAMSLCVATCLSGPTFIVAGLLQQGLAQRTQLLFPDRMLMLAA